MQVCPHATQGWGGQGATTSIMPGALPAKIWTTVQGHWAATVGRHGQQPAARHVWHKSQDCDDQV